MTRLATTDRQFALIKLTGNGSEQDPLRPNVADGTPYVVLARVAQWLLVKLPDAVNLPNGAIKLTSLIRANGDVESQALTANQKTAVVNWLTTNGFVNQSTLFTAQGIADRKQLLLFALRELFGNALDLGGAIDGYDIAD